MNTTPHKTSQKLLIIRFSSVGDVIQTLGVLDPFLKLYPKSEIHWAIRSDLKELIEYNPKIQKVWSLDRKLGFKGLLDLAKKLRQENYTHVYDAHNNLRSHFICFFLNAPHFIRRSKNRWRRFLLFTFGYNTFSKKFIQEQSFVEPLFPWGIKYSTPKTSNLIIPEDIQKKVDIQIPFKNYIVLTPSSAWELKRWPIEYFKQLIITLKDQNFVILGGKEDTFCKDLIPKGEESRVLDLSGQLSLLESCAVVQKASATIGNDTGISHSADQMGRPLIQMIGPVLFGYPAKDSSHVMEVDLPCRPCTKDGRGTCKNPTYKKCLYDITPDLVVQKVKSLL